MANIQMNFALDDDPEDTLFNVIQQFVDVVYPDKGPHSPDEKGTLEYKIGILSGINRTIRGHISDMEVRCEELEEEEVDNEDDND